MAQISYFRKKEAVQNPTNMDFETFVKHIIEGEWQDFVLDVRRGKRDKNTAPLVTISGVFERRANDGLKKHSGLIAIDFDNVENLPVFFEQLKKDKYTHFVFRSISGNGICCVVKIDPKKHLQAFRGLSYYYYNTYQQVIDQSGKDVARGRFISYDPDAYYSEKSCIFQEYLQEKEYTEKNVAFVPHCQNDIDYVVSQIVNNRINICNSYQEWLNVGFALATLGQGGFEYFKLISQVSAMYRPDSQAAKDNLVEKQFRACLKAGRGGITIKTFFYYAKRAGCDLQTQKTKDIAKTAFYAKKTGTSIESCVQQVSKVYAIEEQEAKKIVEGVFQNKVQPQESKHELIIDFLRQNYKIEYNEITEKIELDEEPLDERKLNSLYLQCNKIVPISFDLFERCLYSEEFKSYNPLQQRIKSFEYRGKGYVKQVCDCLVTKHSENYTLRMLGKWLVGLVGGAFGKPANFAIVLVSEKTQIGKTTFFRNLLPESLATYKAEINFESSNKKDDIIPLTKNLLCFVDEWQEVARQNLERLRWIITAQDFDIRKAYRKDEGKYKRIASIAGTSNITAIIADTHFNRRIVPIHVDDIDLKKYLQIDKEALFAELYKNYINNFNYELDKSDVELLRSVQVEYEKVSKEKELILSTFDIPQKNDPKAIFLTNTEIMGILQSKYHNIKLSSTKLGLELKALGFERTAKKRNGTTFYGYLVICRV